MSHPSVRFYPRPDIFVVLNYYTFFEVSLCMHFFVGQTCDPLPQSFFGGDLGGSQDPEGVGVLVCRPIVQPYIAKYRVVIIVLENNARNVDVK